MPRQILLVAYSVFIGTFIFGLQRYCSLIFLLIKKEKGKLSCISIKKVLFLRFETLYYAKAQAGKVFMAAFA